MANRNQFSLTISDMPEDELQVISFEGLEAISSDYAFEINLISSNLNININQLINKSVLLSLENNKQTHIKGIVNTIQRGLVTKDYAFYKVILTSHLCQLKKRTNQRTYRNKSIIEIITTLLTEYGMQKGKHFEFRLKHEYPKHPYTVQYAQTDYDYINYLAETEGIFYYFEHSESQNKLIFADANPFFATRNKGIRYAFDSGLNAEEANINQFDISLTSAPTQVTLRNYNPLTNKIPQGQSNGSHSQQIGTIEEYDIEHYQYPSNHEEQTRAKQLATIEIERLRARQIQAQAYGNIAGLHAGQFISLTEHPAKETEQPWLICEIRHIGKQPAVLQEYAFNNTDRLPAINQLNKHFAYPLAEELQQPWQAFTQGYQNQSLLIPQDTPYRPAKLHSKPKILGTQTAIVTGPKGEEIYCDEYGRVKIQCHWDREGQYNEHSSNWVRVRTGWAHNGYGALAIPRIGMEVSIEYQEGDPDYPLITGALYNKANTQPYELPAHKTKTVFKTSSTKGGKGANEIHIEDKAGQEKIFIQAQKDFEQLTQNNHTLAVNKNGHLQVKGEYSETIEKNRYTKYQAEEHHITLKDRKTEIKGNDHRNVTLAEHTKIGTNLSAEAGVGIHLKANANIIIQAGASITLSAGGNCITIDSTGIKATIPQLIPGAVPLVGVPAMPLAPQEKTAAIEKVEAPAVSLVPYSADAKTLQLSFKDDLQQPYANTPYVAVFPDGTQHKGITDAQGNSDTFYSEESQPVQVQLLIDNESTAPKEPQDYSLRFLLKDEDTGEPLAQKSYKAHYPDGSILEGITDEQGYTRTFYTPEPQEIQIELVEDYKPVKQGTHSLQFRVIDQNGNVCPNTCYTAYMDGQVIGEGVSDKQGHTEIFYTDGEKEISLKLNDK